MVQGAKKLASRPMGKVGKVAKARKDHNDKKKTKKGNPLQLPKNNFRDQAIDDHTLSKAIDKASEQKMAAKFIQGGGKLGLKDVMQAGKDLNKEKRRSMVKRKIGRVEEKLNVLKAKSEMDGKISVK
jgi:hypothetical protein